MPILLKLCGHGSQSQHHVIVTINKQDLRHALVCLLQARIPCGSSPFHPIYLLRRGKGTSDQDYLSGAQSEQPGECSSSHVPSRLTELNWNFP
jgi:hypothetical protein